MCGGEGSSLSEVLAKLLHMTKRFLGLVRPAGAGAGEDSPTRVQRAAVRASGACAPTPTPACLDRWQSLCHCELSHLPFPEKWALHKEFYPMLISEMLSGPTGQPPAETGLEG